MRNRLAGLLTEPNEPTTNRLSGLLAPEPVAELPADIAKQRVHGKMELSNRTEMPYAVVDDYYDQLMGELSWFEGKKPVETKSVDMLPKDYVPAKVKDNRIGLVEQAERMDGYDLAKRFPIFGHIHAAKEYAALQIAADRLSRGPGAYKEGMYPAGIAPYGLGGPKSFREIAADVFLQTRGEVPIGFKRGWDPKTVMSMDRQLVEDFLLEQQEVAERGQTFWAKALEQGSYMPAWMIEFMLTGGLRTLGSNAAKNIGLRILKGYSGTAGGRAVLRTAGWAGGAISRATLGLGPNIFEETMRRRLPQKMHFGPDGDLVIDIPGDGWATALVKGWGSVVIEAASEETGEALTKWVGAGGKWALAKTPFGNRLLSALQDTWLKAFPDKEAIDFVHKISKSAGFSNMLGEIGEERVATALHLAFGTEEIELREGEDWWDALGRTITEDLSNVPQEALLFGLMQAGQAGAIRLVSGSATEAQIQAQQAVEEVPTEEVAAVPAEAKPAEPEAEPTAKTKRVTLPYTNRKDFEQFFQFMTAEEEAALSPLVKQWKNRLGYAAGKEPIYSSGQAYRTTLTPEMHTALTNWANTQLREYAAETDKETSATRAAKGILQWLDQNKPATSPKPGPVEPVTIPRSVRKVSDKDLQAMLDSLKGIPESQMPAQDKRNRAKIRREQFERELEQVSGMTRDVRRKRRKAVEAEIRKTAQFEAEQEAVERLSEQWGGRIYVPKGEHTEIDELLAQKGFKSKLARMFTHDPKAGGHIDQIAQENFYSSIMPRMPEGDRPDYAPDVDEVFQMVKKIVETDPLRTTIEMLADSDNPYDEILAMKWDMLNAGGYTIDEINEAVLEKAAEYDMIPEGLLLEGGKHDFRESEAVSKAVGLAKEEAQARKEEVEATEIKEGDDFSDFFDFEEPKRQTDLLGRPVLEGGASGKQLQLDLTVYADAIPPTDVPTRVALQDAVAQALNRDAQKVLDSKGKYKGVKNEKVLYDQEFADKPTLFIHPDNPLPEMRAAWTIATQGKDLFGAEESAQAEEVATQAEKDYATSQAAAQEATDAANEYLAEEPPTDLTGENPTPDKKTLDVEPTDADVGFIRNIFHNLGIKSADGYEPFSNKDFRDFYKFLQMPSDIARSFPQFAPVYEVQRAREIQKATLDRQFAESTEPYFRLSRNDRKAVDKALIQAEQEGKPYSQKQVEGLGLSPEQQEAFSAIRLSLDRAANMIVAQMKEAGVKQEVIDEFKARVVNYVPHKWYGNWAVVVRETQSKKKRPPTKKQIAEHAKKFLAGEEAEVEQTEVTKELKRPRTVFMTATNYTDRFKERTRLQKLYPDHDVIVVQRKKIPYQAFQEASPHAVSRMVDLAMEAAGADPLTAAAVHEALSDLYKSKGFGMHFIKRENIPGFEESLSRPLAEYFAGFSGYVSKMQAVKAFPDALANIHPKRTPTLYKYSQDYIRYVLGDQMEFAAVKRGLYFWYLYGNIKSASLNLTQNLTLGWPALSKHTGWSLPKLLQAGARAAISNEKGLTKGERQFLRQLEDGGFLDPQLSQEISAHSGSAIMKGLRGRGKKFVSFFDVFKHMEHFNRRAMAVALYDSGIRDVDKASQLIEEAHFHYAKGNRPVLSRGYISPLMTFRSWGINYLTWLKNEIKAKRVLPMARSMAAITLLGGLKALPFVGLMMYAWRKIMGTDPEGELREATGEFGKGLARGVPDVWGDVSFTGSITPIDIPTPSDVASKEQIVSEIGGVVGDVWDRGARVSSSIQRKDYGRAIEDAAPEFLRNPMAAYRMYTQGVRTRSGKPYIDLETGGLMQLTGAEAAKKAMGFQPGRLAEQRDIQEFLMLKTHEQQARKQAWADRFVLAYLNHDPDGMLEIVAEMEGFNALMRKRGRDEDVIPLTKKQAKEMGLDSSASMDAAIKSRMKPWNIPAKSMLDVFKKVHEQYYGNQKAG